MNRKEWKVQIYKNFEKAEAAEREYWKNTSTGEGLSALENMVKNNI